MRLRAERRTGELLKDLARATPAECGATGGRGKARESTSGAATSFRPAPPSPYAQALADTGVSRQQAHRYQALADVPKETFEAALREPEKPLG